VNPAFALQHGETARGMGTSVNIIEKIGCKFRAFWVASEMVHKFFLLAVDFRFKTAGERALNNRFYAHFRIYPRDQDTVSTIRECCH